MFVVKDSDMFQLNNAAQYNAWKGQLYIHEQLVCNVAFQATSTCSIPAQLSDKLELKEVIQLSELKKKLPEDLFQKADLTGQEVSCGNIYYSLYSVIASNIVGSELDKLLKYLKDQDLALIKVINDQGFLILVHSAVIQSSTGIRDENAAQLHALFLFPHQKFFNKKEREEWEGKLDRKEIPSTITNLLPGIRYAIIESRKLQKDKALYPGPLVEQYFRKYAIVQSRKGSSLEKKPEQNEQLSASFAHDDDLSNKCSQLAFSCLQLYISSPVNFSVPLIKMSNILAENAFLPSNSDQCDKSVENLRHHNVSSAAKLKITAESKAGSTKLSGKRAVHEDKEQPSKKATKRKTVKRRERKSKRKSTQRAALTTAETGENQTSNKRRKFVLDSKKQIGSSNEATVKLASPPYPQRRKRGAEVLTAALIQDEKIQTSKKLASSKTNEENKNLTTKTKAIRGKQRKIALPEEPFVVPEKPAKRKVSDPGKKSVSAGAVNKSETLRRTSARNSAKAGRAGKRSRENMKNIAVEQINTLTQSSETLRDVMKPPPSQISESSLIEKRLSMYESHALNLLADLALNSFGSTNLPYIKTINVASANESLLEQVSGVSDSVSIVEHPPKDCSLSAQSTSTEPEHIRTLENDKPKNGLTVSARNIASQKRVENSEKHMSPKAHIAAAKAKARFNATSKISLEHSYSQLPIEDIAGKSAKEACEQPVHVVPDSTTLADVVLKPSIIGLPVLLTTENVCPVMSKKPRAVSTFQDNFTITFHWEPKYDFDLDSKFTTDPLEKTINRALHGPWNHHLKEKVEDVKIILHMWIALFYSKSNKQINFSSRKVVEHSNPAKYVSINTVLDPFEFYEFMDSEDIHSAEDTNVTLPKRKTSDAPSQINPLESNLSPKSGKSESMSRQDLTAPSKGAPKDYNIKLASEIFQMYKNSESALYNDSLQTSVTCKMAPTGKGAQTPANVMKAIYGTNVPTVCYISDIKLLNTELTDKSENCMDIGGLPSEKAKSKEIEHKYSRDFSRIIDAQKSASSQMAGKTASVDVGEDENVKVCRTVTSAGSTSQAHSDTLHLHNVTVPPTTGDSRKTASKLDVADKKRGYLCAESKTVHSPGIPAADDINKDGTKEDPASVELSSKNEANAKHLGRAGEPCIQNRKPLDARMPAGVGHPKTAGQAAESQDLLQASILPSQELSSTAITEEPGGSPNVLQNAESSANQMAIKDSCSVTGIESPSDNKDLNTQLCMDKSCNMMVDPVSKESIQSEDIRQVGGQTDITSNLGPQQRKMDGLEFSNSLSKNMEPDMAVVCNRNYTEEGNTDAAVESVGFEDGRETALENLHDESGSLVEPKETHKLDESVLNEITATEMMSKLKLSSSDEVSDMESAAKSYATGHKTSGPKGINKSFKESSEKTERQEHSIGEKEISTSVVCSMLEIYKVNSDFPEKNHNVQETDAGDTGHPSEACMVGEPEKEVPEKPFLTPSIAQPCLSDDADHLNVAVTDEEIKVSEPSNCDVNLNSDSVDRSLPGASKRAVPCIEETAATDHAVFLAEDSHNEACVVSEPSSAGVHSCEMDGTPVLEDLDVEDSRERSTIEVSILCEKHEGHIHKEVLSECRDHLIISPAPCQGEIFRSNTSAVETEKAEDHLSGAEEMQVDDLLAKAETLTCQTVLNDSVSLGLSDDTIEGISDVSSANGGTLQANMTSSSSDPLMSQHSEMGSEQPVEKQQPNLTGDAAYVCSSTTPTKTSSKDATHSSRHSSSNKKEILSKLKRICLGSMSGHLASSTSENVPTQDENSITGGSAKEQIEVIDLVKTALPHEEDESALKDCDDVVEEPAIDNLSPEESPVTTINYVEPEMIEEAMLSPEKCFISPSLEDVSDSIEQDPFPEMPDICFIVNTGSISKEQYDRWSATSDEDIEYIPSSKVPLAHQGETDMSSSLLLDEDKRSEEQATISTTKCFKKPFDSSSSVCKMDEYFAKHHQDLDYNSITSQENVVITKNIKDPARTIRTINKESSCRSDLDHLFSNKRMVSDDLTRNTLDMENVRFVCKLKEMLRKSSTEKLISGPPFQAMFESRSIPSCSHSTPKCRNPLLITMHCPYRRTDLRRQDSRYPSSYSTPYYEEELWDRPATYSRTIRKVRYSPFHLSRLRYENTLDKSNTDISVILNECVQSNQLKLSSIGSASTSVDRTSAGQLAEEGCWQARRTGAPVSFKSQSVKNMISDLCTNLHSRLQNVARVSEQQISFYIYENDDADFISSTKSLLVKDGHVPTDPQDFLNSDHSESHQLLVIVKNEDVFSSINKIPYLMQLKLLPNVTFAGVDGPEDMAESAYEELFQAGGFVASDKSVLENITLGKLKEVLAILEKMNRTSPWKWLIHYRENRKLKDDKRTEARPKMSLLKSYQQSNVIEILPYHQCDNRSKESSDDLSCLLNLQYQHIHSRLTVYLTGTSLTVTEEYEQNGILVYDVDTFIRKIKKVDLQLQTSYWS